MKWNKLLARYVPIESATTVRYHMKQSNCNIVTQQNIVTFSPRDKSRLFLPNELLYQEYSDILNKHLFVNASLNFN